MPSQSYEIPTLRRKPLSDPPESSTPLKHSRSLSHPFPSIFGKKRSVKKNTFDEDESDQNGHSNGQSPTKNGNGQSTGSSKNPPRVPSKADREPVTGQCMTCDSTVRWPQGLKVYRCTTCLTINDLEPWSVDRNDSGPVGRDGGHSQSSRPTTLSIQRTRAIIGHCVREWLESQLREKSTLPVPSPRIRPSTPLTPTFDQITPNEHRLSPGGREIEPRPSSPQQKQQNRVPFETCPPIPSSPHNGNSTSGPERSRPPPPSRGLSFSHDKEESLTLDLEEGGPAVRDSRPSSGTIFRSLENYIADCFAGCAVLNSSFFTIRPQYTNVKRTKSDEHGVLTSGHGKPIVVDNEPPLFEVDARSLLLGDIGENGSWWTIGRNGQRVSPQNQRDRSPETWRGIVTEKSPRINWSELGEWYHIVTHAGDSWRKKWHDMRVLNSHDGSVDRTSQWEAISIDQLQREIADAQSHVQRALLKATENLLKRPRRPLKHPEDCRFLLMLLVNPLLHAPSQALSQATTRAQDQPSNSTLKVPSDSGPQSPSKKMPMPSLRKLSGLGLHSGIVKRVLGLMSNLSNDVHQFIVAWFSRLSDDHFQRLVDVVGSFVTYRLSRQQMKKPVEIINPTDGLVPSFADDGIRHPSQLHAALDIRPTSSSAKAFDRKPKLAAYGEDWQIRAAARVMALLFTANNGHPSRKREATIPVEQRLNSEGLNAKHNAHAHGQIVPISSFYNTMLDYADLVADFEAWESTKGKFSFCQYPFFLSIWAKIHVLEHDARRQMEVKAREAFFDSILSRKAVSQFLVLKVRRDCLVDDSLRNVSEVVGAGSGDIKKGLKIDFVGEEGIDAGGLRKEWFLLLVREIFDPAHGLFLYDEDSQYCYFNPNCFESSEQFFLVGVLLGLAIYNSTILDVAFPPFVFKKMLASAPNTNVPITSMPRITHSYTLEDLAEYRPALARGLRQLLEFEGDVQETFCRDFVAEVDRYGEKTQVPLCQGGEKRAVTNSNRREFVDLYIRYQLDTAVTRQYEPFKRGFFTVCGGNALSLFRPEEIELLIRGSDEPLDVSSLKAVAVYEHWPKDHQKPEEQAQVKWFWDFFERIQPLDQRKVLSFITGSDRLPAMGATNLVIRVQLLKTDSERFPSARTCFNTICLHLYGSRRTLEEKLWTAVTLSEGFGLK
jgi:E3 ubiquitin-protein ligase HECTD2